MSSLTTFVNCNEYQAMLRDFFCVPSENLPLITYLFSPANRADVLQQQIVRQNGNLADVQLIYSRRILESEVDTGEPNCNATNKRGETSVTYSLDEDDIDRLSFKFDFMDYVRRCGSVEEAWMKLLLDMANGLTRKMETEAATKLVNLIGGYSSKDLDPDGTSISPTDGKTVKTIISAANPVMHSQAWEAIRQTARLNGYCGEPVVTGEYEIANYWERMKVGCCAETGIDFGAIGRTTPIFLPSYRITDAFGNANKFLSFSPGSAVPVYWNRYRGDVRALNDDSNIAQVFVDPRYGIPFDIRAVRTCDVWSVEMFIAWDLFGAPTDMFENSDPLDGVTGIHEYIISNS